MSLNRNFIIYLTFVYLHFSGVIFMCIGITIKPNIYFNTISVSYK